MENARKLADCYFYYYSTCTKGDACNFRHEPEALGCESMCFYWQQGKCFDQHCKLRHMELRKNRKQIPCYWETQPGGCRKKHCSFLHKNPQARIDGIAPSQSGMPLPGGREVPHHGVNRETGEGPPAVNAGIPPGLHQAGAPQPTPSPNTHNNHAPNWQRQVVEPAMLRGATLDGQHAIPPLAPINPMTPMAPINSMTPLAAAYSALQPVDSLVVNFEEESDSESVTGASPLKTFVDEAKHGIDILRLEQIQEETAAFYSYDFNVSNITVDSTEYVQEETTEVRFVKRKLPTEYESMTLDEIHGLKGGVKRKNSDDFRVLSLDEIRERKRRKLEFNSSESQTNSSKLNVTNNYVNIPVVDDGQGVKKSVGNEFRHISKLKRKLSNSNTDGNDVANENDSRIQVKIRKCDNNDNKEEESININLVNIPENRLGDQSISASTSDLNVNYENSNNSGDVDLEMVSSLSESIPDLVKCCTRKSFSNLNIS